MDLITSFTFWEEFWIVFVVVMIAWFIYDKYVQRNHQLLVNYPIIGRLRYVFEEAREPFRQYLVMKNFMNQKTN